MSDTEELIVEGLRKDGKPFRPSDWIERIACQLASFGPDHRLHYSNYVHPCLISGLMCLVVKKTLRQENPVAYEFVLKFAHENNLVVQEDRRNVDTTVAQDRRQSSQAPH
ncbi:MAG TPA: DUF3579 domain-containing protein [Gammaproteobacteria bacterium]|nr:DUF3579 domain-containing protein [Gammaproteobacteria bacterium]